MECKVCKNNDYEINTRKFPKDFCCYSCYEEWKKFNTDPNCECTICRKFMYLKQSRLKRVKNNITCSIECAAKLKSQYFSKDGNHQYNLIGDLNSSFKGDLKINSAGYLLEYCPNHPRPNDKSIKGCRVLQHRLIIERNYLKFDSIYFEDLDGWMVLKKRI